MRAATHNLASLLARSARMWPTRPAIAHGTTRWLDYRGLAHAAATLAAALRRAGLAPGARAVLVSANRPEYLCALVACWWAGLVAVPVNARLHPRELAFVIGDAGARLAFADEAWTAALATEAAPGLRVVTLGGPEWIRLLAHDDCDAVTPVAPADPAWLFYTSGTTGQPKGVTLSHANLLAMAQAFLCDVAPVAPGDAIVHAAPLSHGSGLYIVPHLARAAVNVVPESGRFEPGELIGLVAAWRDALLFAAPTMVKRLVNDPRAAAASWSHLKCLVYGGGPMYIEDARAAFALLGPRLAQIYGQGESPMTITAMDRAALADAMARDDVARIGSVGVAQLGIELRIGDGTSAGASGEVCVRGPTVMQGYWGNAAATASALEGGWLHTGDIGRVDADGFVTLLDRSKDLIISGGANIYPREVEEVLLQHPDVLEVSVVGCRDDEWGETPVAFVVARHLGNADAEHTLGRALDALCLARIARFKRPRSYRFVADLPKNSAGKVLKTTLRGWLHAAAPVRR